MMIIWENAKSGHGWERLVARGNRGWGVNNEGVGYRIPSVSERNGDDSKQYG